MKYYEIKVQLKGITKPPVWRKLRILPNINFEDLHDILQTAMGWDDDHLHQFIVGQSNGNWIYIKTREDIEMSGFDEAKNEKKVTVEQFLKNPKDKLIYEYDFGDSWEHEVVLENIVESKEELPVPFLISAKGACPPEDCGGFGGYEYLKEVFANSKNKEYKQSFKELSEWLGTKTWDAEEVDIEGINEWFETWESFDDDDDDDDDDYDDEVEKMFNEIAARRVEAKPILVNLSNHPKDTWSKEQLKEAKKMFGDVVDLPFPNIPPDLSESEVFELVNQSIQKVLEINPEAVHVMGEMNFTYLFVTIAETMQIPCYASTSERNVLMKKDGTKEVQFKFVQFRRYAPANN